MATVNDPITMTYRQEPTLLSSYSKVISCTVTQFNIPTMAATMKTQSVLQVGQDWFSRPLTAFIPAESGVLYVHFH